VNPSKCPRGTYSGVEGNDALSDCDPCTAGYTIDPNRFRVPCEVLSLS